MNNAFISYKSHKNKTTIIINVVAQTKQYGHFRNEQFARKIITKFQLIDNFSLITHFKNITKFINSSILELSNLDAYLFSFSEKRYASKLDSSNTKY